MRNRASVAGSGKHHIDHTPMSIATDQYEDVTVKVMGFAELCAQAYPLKLDHYQRPYVWSRKKVRQLLADLDEFCDGKPGREYYLGTLLLHRDDAREANFVIDGQQRLSSLAVLFHALCGALPHGLDFHYRSQLSAANLRLAQQTVDQAKPSLRFDGAIFDHLRFTVITVAREDLAFTFFDTQNNRGVPLKATDLLKAYHLRAIDGAKGTDREQAGHLQRQCARRWEAVQVSGPRTNDKRQDFAPELFHKYLWRARNWCGQKRIEHEDHDGILATFQEHSLDVEEAGSLPLYPSHGNQFATRISLMNDDYRLDLKPVHVSASPASLPFSLRQPIHEGIGFFLYAQKYAALLDEIFHGPAADAGVSAFRHFHVCVVENNSHYLRELFNVAVLMYVDRFGYQDLLGFAWRTEMVLGGLRLEKQYIFKEAPLKYLRDAEHNLLDVIAAAYRPEEVRDFLERELDRREGYDAVRLQAVREAGNRGVRGHYLHALRSYFSQPHAATSDIGRFRRLIGLDSQ
jgi:hypothetical protein